VASALSVVNRFKEEEKKRKKEKYLKKLLVFLPFCKILQIHIFSTNPPPSTSTFQKYAGIPLNISINQSGTTARGTY